MFVRLSTQKTHNVQRPFYFGGSDVPLGLDLNPKVFQGTGKKTNKVGKVGMKLYQKGKKMIKK